MARKAKNLDTPVKLRGYPMEKDNLQSFMTEWSLSQAELNHVETIEEANDFSINDEEDADFFQGQTVYEMHDQAEENLRLVQQEQDLAESNETGIPGEDSPPHDQSAPDEPNSLEPKTPTPDQVDKPSPNTQASHRQQNEP